MRRVNENEGERETDRKMERVAGKGKSGRISRSHRGGKSIVICKVERGRALLYKIYRRKNNLGRGTINTVCKEMKGHVPLGWLQK